MTDPTFKTRAELVTWAQQTMLLARKVQLAALEDVKRVTLAHGHLLQEDARK